MPRLPKPKVAGSTPVVRLHGSARFRTFFARRAGLRLIVTTDSSSACMASQALAGSSWSHIGRIDSALAAVAGASRSGTPTAWESDASAPL